jgi:hypothetical protein
MTDNQGNRREYGFDMPWKPHSRVISTGLDSDRIKLIRASTKANKAIVEMLLTGRRRK